jgi:hypothetical protein
MPFVDGLSTVTNYCYHQNRKTGDSRRNGERGRDPCGYDATNNGPFPPAQGRIDRHVLFTLQ